MESKLIALPITVLLLVTFFVAIYMMLKRVIAMKQLKINPQQGDDAFQLKGLLPRDANRAAENYNHLFEQPVVFYVVSLLIMFLGLQDLTYHYFAWIYVIFRIMHSFVQIFMGKVMLRFVLFLVSWLVLAGMIFRVCYQLVVIF